MARKRDLETFVGPNPPLMEADLPKAEPLHAQVAVLAAFEGHSLVWEKGFKVGRGLEPSAARPYAEGIDGKRPCDLLPMPKDEERDFDAGFVAGYKSRFREDLGAGRG